jgi:hypothetical protein
VKLEVDCAPTSLHHRIWWKPHTGEKWQTLCHYVLSLPHQPSRGDIDQDRRESVKAAAGSRRSHHATNSETKLAVRAGTLLLAPSAAHGSARRGRPGAEYLEQHPAEPLPKHDGNHLPAVSETEQSEWSYNPNYSCFWDNKWNFSRSFVIEGSLRNKVSIGTCIARLIIYAVFL